MEWAHYIMSNPKTLGGKPTIKGTRLAVDFVFDLFASGWSQDQVLQSYPQLKIEDIRALFAFAAARFREEDILDLPDGTS